MGMEEYRTKSGQRPGPGDPGYDAEVERRFEAAEERLREAMVELGKLSGGSGESAGSLFQAGPSVCTIGCASAFRVMVAVNVLSQDGKYSRGVMRSIMDAARKEIRRLEAQSEEEARTKEITDWMKEKILACNKQIISSLGGDSSEAGSLAQQIFDDFATLNREQAMRFASHLQSATTALRMLMQQKAKLLAEQDVQD